MNIRKKFSSEDNHRQFRFLFFCLFCFLFFLKTSCATIVINQFTITSPDGKEIEVHTSDLQKLKQEEATLATNFLPKSTFQGVSWEQLSHKYADLFHKATNATFSTYDDYQQSISFSVLKECNALLVFKIDGKRMGLSNQGPFGLIFPNGCKPLGEAALDADTIWQIQSITLS